MFYEPQTLIIVYKDEMLANQMKKMIETKDDTDDSITGTQDNSINVVAWTEKVWLANKKAGNITSKVLFLGNIKGVDKLIPVIDVKSTRYFPTCSHNFPKAGEARFQGRSRLFRLLGKFPYLGESRRILMAVSSKTSSKTRFCYAATRRISSAAVQPSIWA